MTRFSREFRKYMFLLNNFVHLKRLRWRVILFNAYLLRAFARGA